MTRLVKQLVYLGIFLALAALILWPVYRFFIPAPSCTDKVMNGTEEGVDCGSVCGVLCPPSVQLLEVAPAQLIANADGSWDVLVLLKNPNNAYGATEVPVSVTVTDAAGKTLATRRETTYVNPARPRYLLWTLGKLTTAPKSVDVALAGERIRWSLLAFEAAGSVQFGVRNDRLEPSDTAVRYSATVSNQSRFDFDTVDVAVLLRDASKNIVAAGTTVLRTLRAGEERGILIDWPFAVKGSPRPEVIIGTNLFSNENFLREYGSEGSVPGF